MAVKYVKDFSFPASGGFHGGVQRFAKGGHVTKVPAKAKASAKDMPARAKPNAPAKGAPKMESKPKMGKGQGYGDGGPVKSQSRSGSAPSVPAKRYEESFKQQPMSIVEDALRIGLKPGTPAFKDFIKNGPRDVSYLTSYKSPSKSMGEYASEVESEEPEFEHSRGGRIMKAEGGRVPGYDMDRLPANKPPGRTMDLAPSKPERGQYQGYAKGGKVAKVMREYKEGKLHSGSKKGPLVKNREQAVAIALSEARKAGANIPKKAKGGTMTAQERRALDKMRFAERYAPGLSLDMPGKRKRK